MSFIPRTLDVMGSLSIDEQLHLYEKARILKEAFLAQDNAILDTYRCKDKDVGVYEVFLEDSTRTKESFRNALDFHDVQAHIFDANHSSFNKKESYADTFNMLTGYENKLFILRSKLEGVCTWLAENGKTYAKRHKLPFTPVFINAGDGKHEHPTQEMLDEFTFLEKNNRDRSQIHIALVGDLLHGRTVHSKVDGLNIFEQVTVDLIAPPELAMPLSYKEKMKAHGFNIREFPSLDVYMKQKKKASIYYFTRVQLERMGDEVLKKTASLRKAITCREDHLEYIDLTKTTFYHPLPRHKETPVLPSFLDILPLNGWEIQSRNGMFMRIVLVGAMLGVPGIVNDFHGETITISEEEDDFVKDVTLHNNNKEKKKEYSEGVKPLEHGIVIDHIGKGLSIADIKKHMYKIVGVLGLYGKGGEWVSTGSDGSTHKGIIFRPGYTLDTPAMRKLAALSPGCTLNTIQDGEVVEKMRLSMPPKLYNFAQLSCKNISCISHVSHNEHVPASFSRQTNNRFACKYCGKHHRYDDVRDI